MMTGNQYVAQHLLLLYISTISYLRYLFPIKCFDNIYFNGMILKRLNGNSLESKKLLQHIEEGLFNALDKDFVKTVLFYLYHNNEILEIYTMSIDSVIKEGESRSREIIKADFVDLIKTLIIFLQHDRREWCLKSGKIKECKNPNYCCIKVIHNANSTPNFIPPTFDPPTKLKHFTKKYKDKNGDFEIIYQSKSLNTGYNIIKLKCQRLLT